MTSRPQIRCAIYTRKSSEEGLGQEFNSLDAQREACAAYVASQKHEGWMLAPERYDDGGLSGGTLERPALQRLLADIDAGRVQMVVVYKIDRLTRSLADFAKLVERLERAGCSFVSVTQAFNTSTSMGRLTLNVLLSFAQFEREVTAERIRDKIAASKRKGLWMGGTVPLGYDRHPDPNRRELAVNDAEAEVVWRLFRLYDDLGCLRRVEEAAVERGYRSKLQTFPDGTTRGGRPLSRGQIHYLLTNVTYRDLIRHKDRAYPGQHPAIVDEPLWERVQQKLQQRTARPRGEWGQLAAQVAGHDPSALANAKGPPPSRGSPRNRQGARPGSSAALLGLLRDETGDRLTPTHTVKNGRRIQYYVSHRVVAGPADRSGWRLPGAALERAVASALADHLERAADGHALLVVPDIHRAPALKNAAISLVTGLRETPVRDAGQPSGPDPTTRADLLRCLITSGQMSPGRLSLLIDPEALASALGVRPAELAPALLSVTTPLSLRRRGVELRLIAGTPEPEPDPTLVTALVRAHTWVARLRQGVSLAEIATRSGLSESYIASRSRLAFLAPALQAAILAGSQPVHLTLERIVRAGVPLDWDEQAELYGLEP